jgi:ParB family transcriptional regulator, chromosome partitioning protein
MRKSGLGKGLGALIPPEPGGGDGRALTELPLGDISPNPHQPRQHFDEEGLASLAASIKAVGVLQPIIVRRVGGAYELVAGERRWRSARRAGLTTIPAIVRDVDDLASVEQALVENLHRADLSPLEEAAAYQQLIEDFELTHEQVASRVGRSRSAITNTLRLLQLPPSIHQLVMDGRLSAGHARALLGTPDRALQERLAQRIVTEGWSVRAAEEAVREQSGAPPTPPPRQADGADDGAPRRPVPLRPPGVVELEELLAEHLQTSVHVNVGSGKGRVVIDFATVEDLERIYRRIVTG